MSEHMLIAANHEDAMGYAGDPQYTAIHYIGDARLRGLPIREASFTPRATMQPNWSDTLRQVRFALQEAGSNIPVHYISLYDRPEEGADASQEEQ